MTAHPSPTAPPPSPAGIRPLTRALSGPMAALLREGDVEGRYGSRSEAVMATALAAACAGWTESEWRDTLAAAVPELAGWSGGQRRKTGGLRPRNPADADRRLATTWAKALRRVAHRPPVADHFAVRAELADLLAAADADPSVWKGAAGVTNRAVLAALVDVAAASCTLTPSASTRQLAETANISAGTAATALHRLAGSGWLRLEHPAAGTQAASWRLVRPEVTSTPPPAVEAVLDELPPRRVRFDGASSRRCDAFAHPINGGLGRVAARLFDLLDDGARGGLSTAQLAALSGLHPRTVHRHLTALQAAGLADYGGLTSSWARSLPAGDPDRLPAALAEAAAAIGSTGATARRAARHAAEREAFTSYWTDFTNRRGWAVQRGLYRPDQPTLSLPQAA